MGTQTILVGHSLENDLRAMHLIHRRVIDTAVAYPDSRGPRRKRSLKALSEAFLKRKIQMGGSAGHDSAEDAHAALQLALRKIANGPEYGHHTSAKETISLFEKLAAANVGAALIDRITLVNMYTAGAVAAIPVSSDEEAVQKAVAAIQTPSPNNPDKLAHPFVFVQLHDLESHYRDTFSAHSLEDMVEDDPQASLPEDHVPAAILASQRVPLLKKMDAQIAQIRAAMPPSSLLIVCGAHS